MRPNTSHKPIKVGEGDIIDVSTDKTIINPEIDHTAEIEIGILPIKAEETMIVVIDQITEVDLETIVDKMIDKTITGEMIDEIFTDMMIGETFTDKIVEGTTIDVTIDKIMDVIPIGIKGIGKEVQGGTATRVVTEIIQGKDLSEVEILAEIGVGKDSHDHDLEQNQKTEEIVIDQDQSQGLDQVQE